MKMLRWLGILSFSFFFVFPGFTAPVSIQDAQAAAQAFACITYPADVPALALTRTHLGSSRVAVRTTEPLVQDGEILGFVSHYEPSGYVLTSANDEAPPIKLHTDYGSFTNLPPQFLAVIKLELAEDLSLLRNAGKTMSPGLRPFVQQWRALVDSPLSPDTTSSFSVLAVNTVLLSTAWNQDDPYNYYCPAASGGPGGKAYAGCTATALAQILRHHNRPATVARNHTYTDSSGSCQGTHSISHAGMGNYVWSSMPTSISGGSSLAQRQAVGQLIFHAAVALESNFEATGTSAYPSSIPNVLNTFFSYNSTSYRQKSSYSISAWYSLIAADIDANKPVFYAFWQADGSKGHAVVCDGYRNGNQIHINMGWSGAGNAWYNLDSVSYGGSTWTIHGGVFEITPIAGSANDNFASALLISGSNGQTSGTNIGATKETGEPNHAGNAGGKSVWWRWTAPSSGQVTITTFGSNFDTLLAVYTGTSVGGLTPVASNDDSGGNQSQIQFNAVGGTTYRIAVDGYSGASGSITLNWMLESSLANDNFAGALLISGSSGQASGTNTDATKEAGEPNHAGNAGGKSVWWRWTAPSSGPVTINTFGSDFDTLLAVYTGSSVAGLTHIASDDDSSGTQSQVQFNAVGGTIYQIAVDGYSGASGSITLNWMITGGVPGTPSLSSPANGATVSGTSVAFSWAVPSGSPTKYNLQVSTLATFASTVWNGEPTSSSHTVTGFPNDGTVYYWRVRAYNATGWGAWSVGRSFANGTAPQPPGNDNFASATVFSGSSGQTSGTNIRATKETGEPNHVGIQGGKSVWWRWTAPSSGPVTINTFGSNYDTMLAVYTGASVAGLNPIASNDDSGGTQSQVQFNAVGGMIYQIAVDGYFGASGSITLNWMATDGVPGMPALSAPANEAIMSGTSITFSWAAPSGSPTKYNLQVSTLATFASTVWNGEPTSTSQTLTGFPNDGTVYYWRVRAYNATGWGAWSVGRSFANGSGPQPPGNDNFANATVISGASGQTSGTSIDATKEAGEPNHVGNTGGKSVWWRWTAPSSGPVTINTFGSDFDTLLAVYTGSSVAGLNRIASDDDSSGTQSQVQFNAVGGTLYQIAVDGYSGASGSITLNWMITGGVPGTPSLSSPANGATVSGTSVTFSWAAPSGSPTKYNLQVSTLATFASTVWNGEPTSTSQTLTGFPNNGTAYYWRVRAYNASGWGAWSAVRGFVNGDGAPPPVLTTTPATLSVSAAAGTTAFSVANTGSGTMAWTASVTTGGSWARISTGASGNNAGTVMVGYDANPAGGVQRTATIRVTAAGATGSPVDVTVTQAANPVVDDQIVTVGVAFDMELPDVFVNASGVLVSGLPAGLRYNATTRLIAGVPTRAGINTVTISATGVSPQRVTFIVDALPIWAQGTFNGGVWQEERDGVQGLSSMTVSSAGKISGKFKMDGKSYTFSAPSYTSRDSETVFTVNAVAKYRTELIQISFVVIQTLDWDDAAPPTLSDAWGEFEKEGEFVFVQLLRNIWKDPGVAQLLTPFVGYYTANVPGDGSFGSGYLAFTISASGSVKTTGKLADGTSVSLSSAFMLFDEHQAAIIVHTTPSAYKGGSFGGIAFFDIPEQGAKPLVSSVDPFLWVNLNPLATGTYGEGFTREVGLSGGWYDKLINLRAYYEDGLTIGGVVLPSLWAAVTFTDWDASGTRKVNTTEYDLISAVTEASPEGVPLNMTPATGVGTGLSAPANDTPLKLPDGSYDYGVDRNGDGHSNTAGMTFRFTRATGLFSGNFKVWYDYVSAYDATTERVTVKHLSKTVSFRGALTPYRGDGNAEGRGYFLWSDQSTYDTGTIDRYGYPVIKSYKFNHSYDYMLLAD